MPLIESLENRQMFAAAPNSFVETKLVSDIAGAAFTDANLVNAWGLAINQGNGAIWVGDNGTGLSTAYTVNGIQTGPVVTIPPGSVSDGSAPTGVVFNNTSDFSITSGASTAPAAYLFASEDGTISGWNFAVDPNNAIIEVDNSADGAIYKGLAIGKSKGHNFIYAANFHDARIDIFGADFSAASRSGDFQDPNLPDGYAPFNVSNIHNRLYVTYAKQDANAEDDVKGKGFGFVDVFDTNGNLKKRLVSRGALNAPWAVVAAPKGFGPFKGDILVGNFGNGRINAFNSNTGELVGTLAGPNGKAISIEGLWGLQFGNGINAGTTKTLFFAAGIEDEAHGLFGTLTPGT